MTKREFLKLMDEIKEVLTSTNGKTTHKRFTCNIMSMVSSKSNNFNANVKIRRDYEILYKLKNNSTFDNSPNPFLTRISALHLFEIIALEEKQYLNY